MLCDAHIKHKEGNLPHHLLQIPPSENSTVSPNPCFCFSSYHRIPFRDRTQFVYFFKQNSVYFFTQMYLFSFKFFSHLGSDRILSRAPCAMQQVLVQSSVYMSIPKRTQFMSGAVARTISSHFFPFPFMMSLYRHARVAFLTVILWYFSMHQHIYM